MTAIKTNGWCHHAAAPASRKIDRSSFNHAVEQRGGGGGRLDVWEDAWRHHFANVSVSSSMNAPSNTDANKFLQMSSAVYVKTHPESVTWMTGRRHGSGWGNRTGKGRQTRGSESKHIGQISARYSGEGSEGFNFPELPLANGYTAFGSQHEAAAPCQHEEGKTWSVVSSAGPMTTSTISFPG